MRALASFPVPTPAELAALRAVPKHPRDQALLEVLAGCGLRVCEVCTLQVKHLHWTSEAPFLRLGSKEGRPRQVPLNLQTQDALRAWLDQRGKPTSPYVFGNLRTGGKLSRKAVWAVLRHQRAQLDLSRAVVLTPLSGQVAELQVQKGSLTTPRQVLCQILVPEDLKGVFFIPADQMAGVHLHQEVTAWPITAPHQRLTGRLVHLSLIVDPHSGSCRAEVLFPGAGKRVKPGTVAQVRLNP